MKAVRVSTFGGPEVLKLVDTAPPQASRGQAIIEVEAVGVGYVDVMMRRGDYPGLSEAGFCPGAEIAGIVVAVGDGVAASLIGRRVYGITGSGGCAERVAVNVASLLELPAQLTSSGAVALGVNALVAKLSLRKLQLQAGNHLLVRGGSGGIGVLAVQMGVAIGAHAVAASAAGERLQRYGAIRVVDRMATDTADEFDAILDPVGGPHVQHFLGKLKANGRLVVCGAVAGMPPENFGAPLLTHFFKSLSVSMLSLNSATPSEIAGAFAETLEMYSAGTLKPVIHAVVPFEGLADAHSALEAGTVIGKLVAVPR